VAPEHLAEVKGPRVALVEKTRAAVKERLTREITYWDARSQNLRMQEQAGKPNARLNSGEALKRADTLQGRLQKRLEDLSLEAQISPLPPVVLGGSLIVPLGLIAAMTGRTLAQTATQVDLQARAARARAAVMDVERHLGFEPRDVEFDKVESIGRGGSTQYLLSRRFATATGQRAVYTRRRGLDREQNEELLLKHIRDGDERGSPMSELHQVLPGLSRDHVKRLMDELMWAKTAQGANQRPDEGLSASANATSAVLSPLPVARTMI
jgi:hypothetical protein